MAKGKLTDKTAVVTGAGRGIGREVALQLAAEGAAVVVNDLDAEPAEAVVGEILSLGGRAVAFSGSVTASDFAENLIATALNEFGDVHIIVNNAGYTWDNVIQKMSDEQWQAIIDVHLKAPFDILRAALPHISSAAKQERSEGRIVNRKVVNISSIAGLHGSSGQANYASAKAGVVGLTKALSHEWGRYNVNVNCVAFGLIETRLTAPIGEATIEVEGNEISIGTRPGMMQGLTALVPLGRVGTPKEAAGAVVLFTYPESDYISGQVITAAGGFEY